MMAWSIKDSIYINDDPWLIWTYLTAMSNGVLCFLCFLLDPDVKGAFAGPLVLWLPCLSCKSTVAN